MARTTKDLTARMERFRDVLRVNLKHAEKDFKGAARDFYLHFHEVKIDTGLCTADAVISPATRDHFYRPEAFWKVFVEQPELADDPVFSHIYTELCKTVRVSKRENNFLARRFGTVSTSRLYEQAGMKLMRRNNNKHWAFATPCETSRLPVSSFMAELEERILGRT